MKPLFPLTVSEQGEPSLWSEHLYRQIAPGWSFSICAKCGDILINNLSQEVSYEIEDLWGRSDDPAGRYPFFGESVCPPCLWYMQEFSRRLQQWEDGQDWDDDNFPSSHDYWDRRRPQYIEGLSDALWYSPRLQQMRDEYSRYVIRLITLKREQAHKERQESSTILMPRQVPWSWLENTDWGRFAVDTESRAS